jgi:hypothetical protein
MRNRLTLAAIAAAVLIATVSCSGNGGSETRTVTGQVVDVQALTIDTFSSLTVRDDSGKVWEFAGGLFPGFTPSHLLAHRAEGAAVVVTYREEADGTLRVMRLDDPPS